MGSCSGVITTRKYSSLSKNIFVGILLHIGEIYLPLGGVKSELFTQVILILVISVQGASWTPVYLLSPMPSCGRFACSHFQWSIAGDFSLPACISFRTFSATEVRSSLFSVADLINQPQTFQWYVGIFLNIELLAVTTPQWRCQGIVSWDFYSSTFMPLRNERHK